MKKSLMRLFLLHNFIRFAKNIFMENFFVVGCFISLFFLFFPMFTQLIVFFDINTGKLCFSLYLFKFIKIYGGYVTLCDKGLVFHLSLTNAVLLPWQEILAQKKKLEITKGFQIVEFSQIIELGNGINADTKILLSTVSTILSNIILSISKEKKNFIDYKSGTLLLHSADKVKLNVSITAVYNGLVLIIALCKILIQKVINYGNRRKKEY